MVLKIRFIRTAEDFKKLRDELKRLCESFGFELPNHLTHILKLRPELTGDGDLMVRVEQSLLNEREESTSYHYIDFPAKNLPDFISALERLNDKLNEKEGE